MNMAISILLILGGIFSLVFATFSMIDAKENSDASLAIMFYLIGIVLIIFTFFNFKEYIEENTVIKLLNKDIAVDTVSTNPYNGRITEIEIKTLE